MLVQVTFLQKVLEQSVDNLLVILGMRGREKVEGDAQFVPGVQELGMVSIQDVFRGYAFGLGANRDGSAVAIASRNHQHFVAFGPVIASEDVRR